MFKKAKVFMLSTNEKAKKNDIILLKKKKNISSVEEGKLCFCIFPESNDLGNIWEAQHLYITSDEEVKEGDWYLTSDNKVLQCEKILMKLIYADGDYGRNPNGCKKIIATTDSFLGWTNLGKDEEGNLIGNNHKGNGQLFHSLLPQPSQAFIKKYVEEYNKGNIITDVMVEYEYIPGGRMESSPNIWKKEFGLKLKISKDNTITIKKVKDSWSKEEMEIIKNIAIGLNMEFDSIWNQENFSEFLSDNTIKRIARKQQELKQWIEENL